MAELPMAPVMTPGRVDALPGSTPSLHPLVDMLAEPDFIEMMSPKIRKHQALLAGRQLGLGAFGSTSKAQQHAERMHEKRWIDYVEQEIGPKAEYLFPDGSIGPKKVTPPHTYWDQWLKMYGQQGPTVTGWERVAPYVGQEEYGHPYYEQAMQWQEEQARNDMSDQWERQQLINAWIESKLPFGILPGEE